MNDLTIFENEQFGQVRTLNIDGEPWFVVVDVCRALEIANVSDAIKRLDEDEKMTLDSTEGHSGQRGGAQSMNVVNEPGLYTLVLGSRKPEAKTFKRWITHEVLPAIRKTGSYSTPKIGQGREKFELGLLAIKAAADLLNAGEAGRLLMMEKFCRNAGVDTSFLPEYGSNGNHVQMSLTELLKKNNCPTKATIFNKALIADGYLEERERPSSKKDDDGNVIMKKFKVLTEKGLNYGTNMVSRHNTRETQPLYFEDTFMDLYGKVME